MVVEYGDVADYQTLLRVMNSCEADTVFHLAAQASVGKAACEPLAAFEANIKGTWNVLEASRLTPSVKRIIVSSTDKVYGAADLLPCSESAPLQGVSPYDISKRCSESLCSCYFHSFHLPVALIRCCNIFGGGDMNYNRLIPGTIHSILTGKPPVIRSEGSYVRDYLYVEDAVAAFLRLAEKMEELQLYGESFNIGQEFPISVKQLVQRILDLTDSPLKPVILNEKSDEIMQMFSSSQKAKTFLGWLPKHSLDDGLGKTIKWYREHL